jgi:hypothetical protein
MPTQYCSYSVLPPKGKRTSARRSCKKTENPSDNSDLCEVLNERCGLKSSHDQRVRNHEFPRAAPKKSARKSGKKVVRRSAVKEAVRSFEPPAPDAKTLQFLQNANRRSQVPEASEETLTRDAILKGACTPRSRDICETALPKDCRWDQGRLDGTGECVKDSTRSVDGLSKRRRAERTDAINLAEESYDADRTYKVGKVVPDS